MITGLFYTDIIEYISPAKMLRFCDICLSVCLSVCYMRDTSHTFHSLSIETPQKVYYAAFLSGRTNCCTLSVCPSVPCLRFSGNGQSHRIRNF